ncbi:MAG TPA: FIST N-terminal domain-containing protein [Candidatus Binatia bacterium]|nr:FIST N-terminal domain-containing protein [Candidatus Binatia bacterium]
MIRAGAGQSSLSSTRDAVAQAAGRALAEAGIAKADTAIVFFTAEHAKQSRELVESLSSATGARKAAGCSAAGILTGAGEIEGTHGVAVLVFVSDQLHSEPFLVHPLREKDENAGAEIARRLAGAAAENNLVVLLPDTYNGQPQRLLASMESRAGFVSVIGAGASESGIGRTTYQLCGDAIASNAVAGLSLSGTFYTHIDITQGCQPITQPLTITKAEGHLIYEIDQQPALEVFARLLKGPLAEDLRRALQVLFVGLPANRDENSVGPGNYVIRNIIGLDPDKGILGVADDVRAGQAMIFALRDGQRAREDLNQMLARQAARLAGKKPVFGLYFNCCARGASLYGTEGIDTAYIRQALGDFPLIGMFGGYELAPLGRANHLFAYTGVLALITEH